MASSACCIPYIELLPFLGWFAGTQDAAAAATADAQAPAWAAMPAVERAAWMRATILQAVRTTLGRTVGLEEPLMTAGLNSLGKCTTFAGADRSASILLSKPGIQALQHHLRRHSLLTGSPIPTSPCRICGVYREVAGTSCGTQEFRNAMTDWYTVLCMQVL